MVENKEIDLEEFSKSVLVRNPKTVVVNSKEKPKQESHTRELTLKRSSRIYKLV